MNTKLPLQAAYDLLVTPKRSLPAYDCWPGRGRRQLPLNARLLVPLGEEGSGPRRIRGYQ